MLTDYRHRRTRMRGEDPAPPPPPPAPDFGLPPAETPRAPLPDPDAPMVEWKARMVRHHLDMFGLALLRGDRWAMARAREALAPLGFKLVRETEGGAA